jgi:hypothetical protein
MQTFDYLVIWKQKQNMDYWLTNEIKELLCQPCLDVAATVGNRLNNRLGLSQNIDERALTEDFLDLFDTTSNMNVWGKISHLKYIG